MKKTISVILTVVLIVNCLGLIGVFEAGASKSAGLGNIYFGVYYQERETELAALRALRKAKFDDYGHTEVKGVKYAEKNGKYYKATPVEWHIVGEEDGCYVLMSVDILEMRPVVDGLCFYSKGVLRKWLNNQFLNIAFSAEEQADMSRGFVNYESDYPLESLTEHPYQTELDGELTEIRMDDYVTIPSKDDVEGGFALDSITAKRTNYLSTSDANCGYWLRGPALWYYGNEWTYYVTTGGEIDSYAGTYDNGIRPVIKVKKDSKLIIRNKAEGLYDLDLENFTFRAYDKDTFYEVKTHIASSVDSKTNELNNGNHHEVSELGLDCSNRVFLAQPGENFVKLPYSLLGVDDVVVKSPEYRDLIIPAQVAEDWKGIRDNFTAYMQRDKKDGKPYISSVFANEYKNDDSHFVEIQSETLNDAYDGNQSHIIISAVGAKEGARYFILSDRNLKEENSTGEFFIDLSEKFDDSSELYAFFKNPDGTCCEPVPLKIDKLKYLDSARSILDMVKFGLIGKKGQTIEVGDDVPVLSNLEMNLLAQTFPIGLERDGDLVKLSWGVNIFNRSSSAAKTGQEADWHKDKREEKDKWSFFKQKIKNINSASDDALDKRKTIKDLVDSYDSGRIKSKSLWEKENSVTGAFVGFTEFQLKPVKGKDGKPAMDIIFKDGEFAFSIDGKVGHSFQAVVGPGIPAYYYAEFETEAQIGGRFTRIVPNDEVPMEMSWFLNIEPELTIGAGVGIKNVVSGGIYGSASVPIQISGLDKHTKISLKGELGIEGECVILEAQKPLLEGEVVLYDEYWGSSSSKNVDSTGAGGGTVGSSGTKLISRDYLDNASAWLPETIDSHGAVTGAGAGLQTLRRSVYGSSNARLAEIGGKLIAVWIEDDAGRDEYNRTRLVYSVCDKETLEWSDPKPVDDNGRLDAYPSAIYSDGSNAFLTWQNSSRSIDESSATFEDILGSMDVKAAKYDPDADCFEIFDVTENDTYDGRQVVACENGKHVVYWAHNDLDTVGGNGYSVRKYTLEDGQTEELYTGLNYVSALEAFDGNTAYIMYDDATLSDISGSSLYLNGEKTGLGETAGSAVYLSSGELEGKNVFFVSDSDSLYAVDAGVAKRISNSSLSLGGSMNVTRSSGKTRFVWTGTENNKNVVYGADYDGGELGNPVKLAETDRAVSNLSALYSDNTLYALCNTCRVNAETGEKSAADFNLLTVENHTDVSLELPNFDEAKLSRGRTSIIEAKITNTGTEAVGELSYRVSDGSEEDSGARISVNLEPGDSTVIEIPYKCPQLSAPSELTVEISADNDIIEENDRVTVSIGQTDINVLKTAVLEIGDYYVVSATVSNSGILEAGDVKLNLSCGDKAIESKYIGGVSGSAKLLADFFVKKSDIDFADDQAELKITAATSSEEVSAGNNADTYIVTDFTEDNKDTVYFADNGGYGEVYAYCWDEEKEDNGFCENAAWPGERMTYLFEADGTKIYSYTPPKIYDNIIFDCGSDEKQTVDIPLRGYKGNLFYLTEPDGESPHAVGLTDFDKFIRENSLPDVTDIVNGADPSKDMPGDVNGDGRVDVNDATVLQKNLNRWRGTILEGNADVNADGLINMKDVVLIQQYINQFDVVLK